MLSRALENYSTEEDQLSLSTVRMLCPCPPYVSLGSSYSCCHSVCTDMCISLGVSGKCCFSRVVHHIWLFPTTCLPLLPYRSLRVEGRSALVKGSLRKYEEVQQNLEAMIQKLAYLRINLIPFTVWGLETTFAAQYDLEFHSHFASASPLLGPLACSFISNFSIF